MKFLFSGLILPGKPPIFRDMVTFRLRRKKCFRKTENLCAVLLLKAQFRGARIRRFPDESRDDPDFEEGILFLWKPI
jgi:hypothetical protein